jgi:hypothetical protein
MKFLLVLVCLIASGAVSAQQIDVDVYHAVEPKLKASYDKQVTQLRVPYDAHVADFKKLKVAGNWADKLDYDDWVKMMFQNETNMAVSCAEDLKVSADDIKNETAHFKSEFVPCFSRRAAAMNAFFRIDNLFVTFNTGKFVNECEPKARLASRESLPPYDFVKPKNPAALRLYNFGAYLTCVFDQLGLPPSQFHIDPRMLVQ